MSVRRWHAVLSLCLAIAMVATLFPVGAFAAPRPPKPPVGAIQGTVTGFDGAKLSGVKVVVYTMVGQFSQDYHAEPFAEATTSKRGTYALELTPGTYRLGFFPTNTARYAWEYYPDASMAWQGQDVTVVAKGKVTANAQLAPAGRISGTVVDDQGTPMVGVEVLLNQMWPATLQTVMSVTTGPGGSFDFTGLAMDTEYGYGLWANDPTGWHRVSENLWNRIDTAGQQVTGVVIQMEAAGRISGTVLNEGDEPVAGIQVTPYSWSDYGDGNGGWDPMWWSTTETGPDGTYVLGALGASSYVVLFSDGQARYAQQFYSGKVAAGVADEVGVTADQETTGIDVVLSEGGVISGTVSTPDGPYVGQGVGFEVWADDHYEEVAWAECDENGDYSARLPFGSYRVYFSTENWSYVPEYWDNTLVRAEATPVELTELAPLASGIDAMLARPSYITGYVTDEAGNPLQGIGVGAHTRSPDGDWFDWVSGADTDENGFYRIPVSIGAFRITFDDGQGNYVGEVYNDKQGGPDAGDDVFVVAEEQVVSGIDASLARASHIRGHVVDGGGNPIVGMGVAAGMDPNFWEHVAWAETDENGDYDLVVPAGTYRVNFTDWNQIGFLDEWYDNAPDPEQGVPITLTAGEEVTGIDAELTAGAHIRGRVTNSAQDGLASIGVNVHLAGGNPEEGPLWVGGNETDGDGYYDVLVPPGTEVIVHFEDYNTNTYLDEWYNDTRDWTQANPVMASAGTPLEGVDAELAAGAHIRGRVVNEAGDGIAYAGISIHIPPDNPDDPWAWPNNVAGLDADENGYYDMLVPEGENYLVMFQDWNNNEYLWEWYDDTTDWRQATPVATFLGAPAEGIDATLTAGAHIRGRVIDEGGNGIEGAAVGINVIPDPNDPQAQPNQGVGGGTTDSEGYYDAVVPAGSYIVQIGDWQTNPQRYLQEWYDDQQDWHLATPVITAPGAPAENVNATLTMASHIRGRLVDGNGNGVAGVNAGLAVHGVQPWMWNFVGGSQTDGDGYYDIPARAGTYHIQFSSWTPDPLQQPWANEWYHESMTGEGSAEVTVTAGETLELLTNVMEPPGFVAGRVTDAVTGLGIDSMGVSAVVDATGGGWWNVSGVMTSGGGYYTLVCHPGLVRIGTMNPSYQPKWYPDGSWPGGGELLEIQSGVTLSPIDFELTPNTP